MSIDPEGVADLDRNSFLAVIAGLLSATGTLSVIEPRLLFLSATGLLLGSLVLVFAKRWQIASVSRFVAAASMILGAFSLGAGFAQNAYWKSYHASKAISLSENYMEALSRGDRNLAIKLVGLPQLVQDEGEGIELSREQKAVRAFLADALIQEITKRGSKAQWVSTGLLSTADNAGNLEAKVGFIDKSMANQVPIVVTVKMQPPVKYSVDTKTRWIVLSVDRFQKNS